MVQWDYYIFRPVPNSVKVLWITVGHNPDKISVDYEEAFHVVPGRAAGAGGLPSISMDDYMDQFAPDLPAGVTTRIKRAFEKAKPAAAARIPRRSEPDRVAKLIIEIRISAS
ncbi:hypothetical protein C4561_00035 [candidate division WWE3 bacterium]|jgi:hypothetical protein|uniref:Uncharacterized protein n=1 Tax=candidate division WWE3 bacterium TaxID=2053526 RepID=A0A3A4ZH79_UNCKA|nr:MAG: hypothetical protein C4561_00035 [candidate division WWE3 bacterium]